MITYRRPILIGLLVGLPMLLGLTGCVVGPEYNPPGTCIPDAWHQELENGEFVGTNELGAWWRLLDDEVLNELIVGAGVSNLDLEAAFARICQARADRCVASSQYFPQLNADGSFLTSKQSANAFGGGGFSDFFTRDLWTLQSNVAWEPDLFGRIYRTVEAADNNVWAQIEAYRDILVILYGDVAQTYVQIRTLQTQLRYAHQNVALQEKALDLASKRVAAGIAPNLDEFQAQSNLASTEAEIPPLELELQRTLNRLSVLLGQCPGSLHDPLALPAPIPDIPEVLPIIIPYDAVRQRPDIRQAERLIAVRTAEVGIATSELFPRFSMGGTFGLSTQNLSSIFSGDSFGYGFGPSFQWPIFLAGRIRCNVQGAECAVDEAVAVYEQTILLAMEEVENALVGFRKEKARREALERTVEASLDSLESVLALYRAGKSDFLNVLNTQRTLAIAQNQLAITEGQIVIQLVGLYRALGGGWDPNHHEVAHCARATCPPRGNPDAVENFPVGNAADRYFDVPSQDGGSTTDADRDRNSTPDDSNRELPTPWPSSDEHDDGMFDRVLKELEQRLDESPK